MKIDISLYGGKGLFGGRETPLEADVIDCDACMQCSLYRNKKCLRKRSFGTGTCKYGHTYHEKGYTSRAKKYYAWKKKFEEDELYHNLKYPNIRVAVIGEFLWMTLAYVTVRKAKENDSYDGKHYKDYFITTSGFGNGEIWLPLNEITSEFLNEIFSYEPYSIMGGVIKDYQEKIVPEIVQDIKKIAPNIYEDLIKDYPAYYKKPNYIGKKAYVCTLKPNTKFEIEKFGEWIYDGEYIINNSCNIGLSLPWDWRAPKAFVKLKVTDDMTFEVLDSSICDDDTKFE